MLRKSLFVLLALFSVLVLSLPALAQDSKSTNVAEGLSFPRGIAFDADGNLYVAESGLGGEQKLLVTDDVTITGGLTGQITKIAPDGTTSTVVGGLPSLFNPNESAAVGVYRAVPTADSLWLAFTDDTSLTLFSDSIVEIDLATSAVKHYIDLSAYEIANNPDGTDEILSNPADIAIGPDGTLYIVDAGANTLYTWTEAGGLNVVHAWKDDPVPTSIVFAKDKSYYVSFLGTGLVPGAGHIEHWAADGSKIIETFANLTTPTDLLLTDAGDLYAVQIIVVGDQGPQPNSGSVVKVTADGATPIIEGLNSPFGIAQDADGNLYVSLGAAFTEPGKGSIIKIPKPA
ncbi:MAG: ScyD/ScyE family protein [Chloroflexota bacterium]